MNLYRLAEQLHKTVGELQTTLTVEEFNGWIAYSRIKEMER